MFKILTILLILVSTIAFSQDTPTHISKLEKQYDTHKILGWTSIGLAGGFYTLSGVAYEHRVNQLTPRTQQVSMGAFGLAINVKGIYHFFKARKIKKQIYTQKHIINLYEL